jgi:hypothetical protein
VSRSTPRRSAAHRDITDLDTQFLPAELRERSTRVMYKDFDEAQEITDECKMQMDLCVNDALDVFARHYQHIQALELQLRTALKASDAQAIQYAERSAFLVEGVKLEGQPLEHARRVTELRFTLRLLARAQSVIAEKLHAAALALEPAILDVQLEHRLEVGKTGIMGEHLIDMRPASPTAQAVNA